MISDIAGLLFDVCDAQSNRAIYFLSIFRVLSQCDIFFFRTAHKGYRENVVEFAIPGFNDRLFGEAAAAAFS